MINTSIRRALVLSSLVLGATTLFSAKAMANTSGSVTLNGTVASTLALVITTLPEAGALPLNGSTQQIVRVADLGISTNQSLGYTVTAVTSGNLVRTLGGASIAYQVITTADGVVPGSADFTAATGASHTFASTAANAANTNGRDLHIMYTPAALQDPGIYNGTITVSVADKS